MADSSAPLVDRDSGVNSSKGEPGDNHENIDSPVHKIDHMVALGTLLMISLGPAVVALNLVYNPVDNNSQADF